MTREFNAVVAHFGEVTVPGRIEALEGGRGLMRVSLSRAAPEVREGAECDLEMHDGARFHVLITEELPPGNGGPEVRMKLLGRSQG